MERQVTDEWETITNEKDQKETIGGEQNDPKRNRNEGGGNRSETARPPDIPIAGGLFGGGGRCEASDFVQEICEHGKVRYRCKECRAGGDTSRTADKKRRQQPAHEASEPAAKRHSQSGATSGEQAAATAAPVTVKTEVEEVEVEVEADVGAEVAVKTEEAEELEVEAEPEVRVKMEGETEVEAEAEVVVKMEEAEELEVEAEPEVRVKVEGEELEVEAADARAEEKPPAPPLILPSNLVQILRRLSQVPGGTSSEQAAALPADGDATVTVKS